MILSILFDKLRKNTAMQTVLGFLPILFIILYISMYMFDMMNASSVLTYNDNKISNRLYIERLKPVSSYEKLSDTRYSIIVDDISDTTISLNYGDLVYSVYADSIESFRYKLPNGVVLTSNMCHLCEGLNEVDDKIEIYTSDGKFVVAKDGLVAEVYLTDDGDFSIQYASDDINEVISDGLSGIQVVSVDENKCDLLITMQYSLSMDNQNINFCTVLPTDDVYLDLDSLDLVKNVSSYFAKNMILSSNILVVIFSMTVYCVLLFVLGKKYNIPNLYRREVIGANAFAIITLIFCIGVTFMML